MAGLVLKCLLGTRVTGDGKRMEVDQECCDEFNYYQLLRKTFNKFILFVDLL